MRQGIHVFPAMDRVVHGRDFAEAAAEEVQRLDARAVLVLASATLARETDLVTRLRDALGSRLAGVRTGIGAHTPRPDVVAAANEARAVQADLLLTLGGGSLTDAAKMMGLCLGNDVTDPAQLDAFRAEVRPDGSLHRPAVKPPGVRFIAIPTTLSAGEYTAFAGCTDPVRKAKESFGHPLMIPRVVILDPAVTRPTPEWLFLSTGLRAVDHAVETLCSVRPSPFGDAGALQALRLLGRGLPGVKADPSDLEARHGLPTRGVAVDRGIAGRGADGGEPRHRSCSGRDGGRPARLHVVRHAAARPALQRRGPGAAAGDDQRDTGPAGCAGG